jgi:hypothetical protein
VAFRIQNPYVKGIGEIDCDLMWWYLDVAVAVLEQVHDGKRGGGVFNLRGPNGEVVFSDVFRNPAADKIDKYDRLAAEKTERLWKHPGHTLSWQSMNVALEQYQGAARATNGLIGGFSGFTAEEDEALVLWVFSMMGWMTAREAAATARISSNSCYEDLCVKFGIAVEWAD